MTGNRALDLGGSASANLEAITSPRLVGYRLDPHFPSRLLDEPRTRNQRDVSARKGRVRTRYGTRPNEGNGLKRARSLNLYDGVCLTEAATSSRGSK